MPWAEVKTRSQMDSFKLIMKEIYTKTKEKPGAPRRGFHYWLFDNTIAFMYKHRPWVERDETSLMIFGYKGISSLTAVQKLRDKLLLDAEDLNFRRFKVKHFRSTALKGDLKVVMIAEREDSDDNVIELFLGQRI